MGLAEPSTLGLAALISAPALWHGFVQHDLDPQTALIRFLVAVPVSAIMLSVFRSVIAGYRPPPKSRRVTAERLDGDEAGADTEPDGDDTGDVTGMDPGAGGVAAVGGVDPAQLAAGAAQPPALDPTGRTQGG